MGLFLLRFWPALIPLLVYLIWHQAQRHKAKKAGEPLPHFREGPLYWMVLATLLVAGGCFVLYALMQPEVKGEYIPPHMENGVLVPGTVKQQEPSKAP